MAGLKEFSGKIWLLFLCIAYAVFPVESGATSLVCLRSPDAIVLAADSRMTVRNSAGESYSRECKIHREGDIVFALVGFYKDPVQRYDLRELVASAIGKGMTLADATDAVTKTVSEALRAELLRLRSESPGLYAKHIEGKTGPLVEILLARYEESVPKVALIGLRPSGLPSGNIALHGDLTVCPGECSAKSITAFFLTDRTAIDAYLGKGGKLDWVSPANAAKKMVELVIEADTPGVGPPVDVLRIDGKGMTWVERKPECPRYDGTEAISPGSASGSSASVPVQP